MDKLHSYPIKNKFDETRNIDYYRFTERAVIYKMRTEINSLKVTKVTAPKNGRLTISLETDNGFTKDITFDRNN